MAATGTKKGEVKQISSFKRKITNIDFELKSPVVRGMIIFAVVAMIAAFALYHIRAYTGSGSGVKTQTAVSRTITKSISAEGMVIREERVLSSDALSGTVVPRVSNGSKVSSGDTVAEVFKSSATAETLMELDSLNAEIAYYEEINHLGHDTILPNKDSYNQNIADSLFDLLDCIDENRLSELNEYVMDLSLNATKKQIALGKSVSVDNILSSLYNRKDQLSSMVTSGTGIYADAAGYYVNKADGYETITDYDSVLGITPEEVNSLISSSPKPVSNNVGKLITQFNWYIVCVVDFSQAEELSINQKINISVQGLYDNTVQMTLVAKNEGEGNKVALVFRSNVMNSDVAALRLENIKICLEEYSGYAVDKKALRTVDGETGVYVQLGNLVRFRKVEITYSDDNIVLAAANGKNGFLRLYDEIITEGTDLYDGKIIA